MIRFTHLVAIVCACSFASLGNADEKKPALDQEFLIQTSTCGHAALKYNELAEKQGSDAAVKAFASKMVKEQSQCNEGLAKIAKDKSIAIAVGTEKDTRDTLARLEKLKGAEFDREYLKVISAEFEKGIRMFEAQSKNGKDDKLNTFATLTLPRLKDHLKEARDLAAKIK
jgi:putative membrane protein